MTEQSCASQGAGNQYKVILQRKDPGNTLLGDLLHLGSNLPRIGSPLAALHRVFLGKYVPLEVFNVNMTALSPEQLCGYLVQLNPGKHLRLSGTHACEVSSSFKKFQRLLHRLVDRLHLGVGQGPPPAETMKL